MTKLFGAKGAKGTKRRRKVSKRPPLTYELAHFIVATGEDLYLKMLLVDNLMHVRRRMKIPAEGRYCGRYQVD